MKKILILLAILTIPSLVAGLGFWVYQAIPQPAPVPALQAATVCHTDSAQTFQQARRQGLIDNVVNTGIGYLDQIYVMPLWQQMTLDQKRGLAVVAACSL